MIENLFMDGDGCWGLVGPKNQSSSVSPERHFYFTHFGPGGGWRKVVDYPELNDRIYLNNDRNKLKNTICRFITLLSLFQKYAWMFATTTLPLIQVWFSINGIWFVRNFEFSFTLAHVNILLKFAWSSFSFRNKLKLFQDITQSELNVMRYLNVKYIEF